MNRIIFSVLLTAVVGLGLFSAQSSAMERAVDCDKGQSIQDAIEESASRADPLEIHVKGTCYENVVLRRPSVTIDGDNEATIVGYVYIFTSGARLQYLTVTGPGRGVVISGGGGRLTEVTLTSNDGVGLRVARGEFAWVIDSMISVNNDSGVYVEGATLETRNSNILQNAGDGILADNQSNVILRSTNIADNDQFGLSMNFHSVLDLKNGTNVTGNRQLDIYAGQDSAIRISSPDVNVQGQIWCGDTESSFINQANAPLGLQPSCSGFNWWE